MKKYRINFPKTKKYFEVFIHPTRREMYEYCEDEHSHHKKNFLAITFTSGERKKTIEAHFYERQLKEEIILHEVVHVSIFWLERKPTFRVPSSLGDEELALMVETLFLRLKRKLEKTFTF